MERAPRAGDQMRMYLYLHITGELEGFVLVAPGRAKHATGGATWKNDRALLLLAVVVVRVLVYSN